MNWVAILCCTMLAMITCLVPQSLMGGRSAIRFIQNHQRRAILGRSSIGQDSTLSLCRDGFDSRTSRSIK